MSSAERKRRSSDWLFKRLSPECAGTLAERAEAVRTALSQGMPLHQIEAYLDWLDAARGWAAAAPEGAGVAATNASLR
jgi:hypothetical protein